MSITVLNYLDQALVDQVNTQAAERAEAAKAAQTASISTESDFSSVLNEVSQSYQTDSTVSATNCPEDLRSIFEEAASTFGVSVNLLTSIARAESNFNANAVSHAGAVGIMQLMPATAASLGVSNSYDPRENIMGGAKLISQLLIKYNGDTSLALAAYNAGSGNVDKYGGIPPFTETQNYVKKVLSYMEATPETSIREELTQTITDFVASKNISKDTLDLLASMLKLVKPYTVSSLNTTTAANTAATATPNITVTVVDDSKIVNNYVSNPTGTETPSATPDTPNTPVSSADNDSVSADNSANANSGVTDTSGSAEEPVTDNSGSGNAPVVDNSGSDNAPVVDNSDSNDAPVVDNSGSNNEPVVDSSGSDNAPVIDNSGSDNEPVVDNSGSNNEPVIDNSGSNDEPVIDNSGSDNTPVIDNSGSNNEPVTDNSGSNNEPVIDNSGSDNEPVIDNSGSSGSSSDTPSVDTEGSNAAVTPADDSSTDTIQ